MANYKLITFFFLLTIIVSLHCQELDSSNVKKQNILFNKSESTINRVVDTSTSRNNKIIFTKDLHLDSKIIQIVSSESYRMGNDEFNLGEDGINLINVFEETSPEAVNLVKDAYSTKRTGKTLMIVGVAIAVIGTVVTSTWVKTSTDEYGNYKVNWYWIPGITIGAIVGGIGYSNYTSLRGDLQKAVDVYNSKLKSD